MTPRSVRTVAAGVIGTSGTTVASPSPGTGDDWLFGVSALPGGGGFWAVGTTGRATLTEFHC